MFGAGVLRETETDDKGVKSLLENLPALWRDSRDLTAWWEHYVELRPQ